MKAQREAEWKAHEGKEEGQMEDKVRDIRIGIIKIIQKDPGEKRHFH